MSDGSSRADEGRQVPPPPPPGTVGPVLYTPPASMPYIITAVGLGFTALVLVFLWLRFFRRRAQLRLLAEHAAMRAAAEDLEQGTLGRSVESNRPLRPVSIKEAVVIEQPDGTTEYAYSDAAGDMEEAPQLEEGPLKGKDSPTWLQRLVARGSSVPAGEGEEQSSPPYPMELASVTVVEGTTDDFCDETEDEQMDRRSGSEGSSAKGGRRSRSCNEARASSSADGYGQQQNSGEDEAGASGSQGEQGSERNDVEEEGCSSGAAGRDGGGHMEGPCSIVSSSSTASLSSLSGVASSSEWRTEGGVGGRDGNGVQRARSPSHAAPAMQHVPEATEDNVRAVVFPGSFHTASLEGPEPSTRMHPLQQERTVQPVQHASIVPVQSSAPDAVATPVPRRLGLTHEALAELQRADAEQVARAHVRHRSWLSRLLGSSSTRPSTDSAHSRSVNVLGAQDTAVPVMPLAWG